MYRARREPAPRNRLSINSAFMTQAIFGCRVNISRASISDGWLGARMTGGPSRSESIALKSSRYAPVMVRDQENRTQQRQYRVCDNVFMNDLEWPQHSDRFHQCQSSVSSTRRLDWWMI